MALTDNEIHLALNSHESGADEEFALSAPVRGIFPGDNVRVSYRNESGRKMVARIEELSSRQ